MQLTSINSIKGYLISFLIPIPIQIFLKVILLIFYYFLNNHHILFKILLFSFSNLFLQPGLIFVAFPISLSFPFSLSFFLSKDLLFFIKHFPVLPLIFTLSDKIKH